jgi:hypothetical protein
VDKLFIHHIGTLNMIKIILYIYPEAAVQMSIISECTKLAEEYLMPV